MNPPGLLDVCRFLRSHLPARRAQERRGFARWVFWYWRDARVGVVHNAGQIVAVCLARCIHSPAEADQPYAHDEAAPLVWVQDIASDHPLGVPCLLKQSLGRFGRREAFCGHVFSRSGELRMLPYRTVLRLSESC